MSYEIEIYVGIRQPHKNGDWFQVLATIDLSSTDAWAIQGLSRRTDGHKIYFYDGTDERITEDKYGKELTSFPLSEVLEALRQTAAKDSRNRRYKPALALLEGFQDFPDDEIECFLFGH